MSTQEMTFTQVNLTRGELAVTKHVGLLRSRAHRNLEAMESRAPGSGHVYGRHEEDGAEPITEDHRQASAGMLVYKNLGLFWPDCYMDEEQIQEQLRTDPFRGPLVVRATKYISGRLVLHRNDPGFDKPFVCVVGDPGSQRIAGWLFPGDGKVDAWWPGLGNRPCFMVPQPSQRGFEELLPTIMFPRSLPRGLRQ